MEGLYKIINGSMLPHVYIIQKSYAYIYRQKSMLLYGFKYSKLIKKNLWIILWKWIIYDNCRSLFK